MVGWLYALAPDEYQAWVDEQWPPPAPEAVAAAPDVSAALDMPEAPEATATDAVSDMPETPQATPEAEQTTTE